MLYVGGGVISAGAADELRALAELMQVPVTTTLMGLGAFDERLPLSLGMLGMHGTVTANYAVHECDLLVGVGVRFDDRVTGKLSAFAPQAKAIIHIDVDPAEIGKNVEPTIPIVGDARHVLAALVAELEKMERPAGRTAAWLRKIDALEGRVPPALRGAGDGTVAPQFVVQEIERVTGGDALIVTDVGQHQMWSTLYFHYRFPRQWISSGGLGTMGFGLPAAIGAKLGRPDKTVIDISGDGGFQMTMQELATAVNYDVPDRGRDPEQRLSGHGPPVAGPLLEQALLVHLHRGAARLRHAGRGLRRQGSAGDRGGPGGRRPDRGDRQRAPHGDRLQDRPRRERLSDGAGRPGDHRADRRQGDTQGEGVEAMKHTLSVLVENKPGVLTRVAGLFARRGFNIQSLAVGESEDPRLSRMTITIDGAEHPIDQVTKQLHKLINVVKIRDLDPSSTIAAELMLIKVAAEGDKRTDVLQIAEIFKAKIVDVERRSLVLRVVGTGDKLEALLEMLQPIGVLEVTRTGTIAIGRGRG